MPGEEGKEGKGRKGGTFLPAPSSRRARSSEGLRGCPPAAPPNSPGRRTVGRYWTAAGASRPGTDSAASPPVQRPSGSQTRRPASARAAGSRSPAGRRGFRLEAGAGASSLLPQAPAVRSLLVRPDPPPPPGSLPAIPGPWPIPAPGACPLMGILILVSWGSVCPRPGCSTQTGLAAEPFTAPAPSSAMGP